MFEQVTPEALLIPIDHLCEHGVRSLMACRFLVQQAGFRRVTNVRGGMSVWPY